MKTKIFDFKVPDHLIAQRPLEKRSASRLLVYDRLAEKIIDSNFIDLTFFLSKNDFLVFNNSKVIPARLTVIKKDNNRTGEILILRIIDEYSSEIITDKNKKYPEGTLIILPENNEAVIEKDKDDLIKILRSEKPIFNISYFEKNGLMPLPPYIRSGKPDNNDITRYQTFYAKYSGSAAAPTAGLHFDEDAFNKLKEKEIDNAFVSLHVGLGTFQPIYAENIEDHKIHTEDFLIESTEAYKINIAFGEKKRIIPVGTTSLRALESAFDESTKTIKQGESSTSIYIYPGYEFKISGGLITNFHTPKSSLAVLVSSLVGVERLLEIYDHAVRNEYRFFSYGDAMLII